MVNTIFIVRIIVFLLLFPLVFYMIRWGYDHILLGNYFIGFIFLILGALIAFGVIVRIMIDFHFMKQTGPRR